jgi:hypothetical protein
LHTEHPIASFHLFIMRYVQHEVFMPLSRTRARLEKI